tara:strand:- start:8611 stop:9477 length:867 start_codon:yes stop_codon:yes gene_type:complete
MTTPTQKSLLNIALEKIDEQYRPNPDFPKCCFCEQHLSRPYGNNPQPLKQDGECCDMCNSTKVIPARMTPVDDGIAWWELMMNHELKVCESKFHKIYQHFPDTWEQECAEDRGLNQIWTRMNEIAQECDCMVEIIPDQKESGRIGCSISYPEQPLPYFPKLPETLCEVVEDESEESEDEDWEAYDENKQYVCCDCERDFTDEVDERCEFEKRRGDRMIICGECFEIEDEDGDEMRAGREVWLREIKEKEEEENKRVAEEVSSLLAMAMKASIEDMRAQGCDKITVEYR